MKTTKKIIACILSCSMLFYSSSPSYTEAKSSTVNKKAYTISKKAGKYNNSVKLKLKTKKGYTVYYSTEKKLSLYKKVNSGKSKTFTFKKTTTLKVYAVKKSKKLTAAKLKKVKSSAVAKYKYTIIKKNSSSTSAPTVSPESTVTQTPAATTTSSPSATETASTKAPSSTSETVSTKAPDSSNSDEVSTSSPATATPTASAQATEEPTPSPAATAKPTASPTSVPISTPGNSHYTGDDSLSDYVAPTRTVYDTDDTDISYEDATEITLLSSASSKITEDNYTISKKNKLTITAPGTYVIHSVDGETTDGLIEVKYSDDTMTGTVHIILDGVRMTSSNNTAPDSDTGLITIKSNVTKAVITLADGSTNTLTDTGETGIDSDDNTSTTYTAGIVCKKVPLTINGTGTLNIISTNGNGIKCTDELKIIDSAINVSGPDNTAVGHNGITGKTGLTLKNAAVNVHSNNDGLKTTLDETDVATNSALAVLGNMEIDDGDYTVTSENGDGISAYRTLYLNPSTLTVTTKNAASSTEDGSYKGVKAGTTIYVPETAGTINADTTATYSSSRASGDSNDSYADDTIHCNGYIKIDGGTFNLASGDDGIHSDTGLVINGGTILITECYEGLESGDITINDGNITITSRDDGLNAAGGKNSSSSSDSNSSSGSFPGNDNFNKGDSSSSTEYQIIINGGTITVDAEGDGIDSNGNIFFKGGTVTVNGPTNGGNGALDYGDGSDCVCEISGGTLIATGASGMDVSPTNGSSQPSVNVRFTSSQSANTYVVIKDSSGNTVMTARPTKTFQSVVLSCSDFTLGSTYTVYYGSDLNSLSTFDTFTFSSVSTSVGSSSNSGQMPGGGNFNPGGNSNGGAPNGGNSNPNGNRPGGRN